MNASNPFSLAGRVALVTGSSRGLGRAMGVALGKAGAKVAFNYLNSRETAERAFADYKSQKLEGILVQSDVTDEDSVSRMTKQVAEQIGPIDIVVINATCDQPHKPIEEYDWDFFQSMVDFFIKSPFLLSRACLPHMKKQRWGRIINIGSEVVERDVGGEVRHTALHDLRADVDDAAPSLLLHVRQAGAAEEERALDEEIDHALEEVPVVFLDGLVRLIAGGIDDHDVNGAKLFSDLLRHAAH